MRDAIITLIVLGIVPWTIRQPYIGIMAWSWLGYMNPHRLCWSFAVNMPFAQIVAISLLIGLLFSKEEKKLPITREVMILFAFNVWMLITTFFAYYQSLAWIEWDKVWKIQLMTFLTLLVIRDIRRLHYLVWIICLSLGYYGIKGGIFTLLTGGNYKIWGPAGSFIGGNNEIGLALIMTMPLMRYLQITARQKWLKIGLLGGIILTSLSVVGTHSRGALLGLMVVTFLLIVKGKNRFLFGALAIGAGILIYQFMPESWHQRMGTIKTYENDGSAMGRINAWRFAFNLATKRLFGGGFEAFHDELFNLYAPIPDDVHDAHSIYFEILGEQGFIGLAIFLLLMFFTWRSSNFCIKVGSRYPDLQRLVTLMRMTQTSIAGYAVSGAFLGLAYFDLYYHLIAIVIIAKYIVHTRHVAETQQSVARTEGCLVLAAADEAQGFVRRSLDPRRKSA